MKKIWRRKKKIQIVNTQMTILMRVQTKVERRKIILKRG
jgi:hypothetical protein